MGLLCTDQGEHEQALEHYRRALELREQLESEQEVAEVLVSLAWAHSHRRAWNEMRPIADRAWTLAARLGRRDLLTRLLWLEAEIALAEGRPDDAHAAYEQALETSRPSTRSGHRSDDNDRLIALYRETRLRNEKSTPGRLGTLSSSPRPRDA
jgi:tetratricopeptide (TPR) repeat protein